MCSNLKNKKIKRRKRKRRRRRKRGRGRGEEEEGGEDLKSLRVLSCHSCGEVIKNIVVKKF